MERGPLRSRRPPHAPPRRDFIAGMTDNYAVSQHRRLFAETPDLHWVIWPGREGGGA